MKILLTAFEPFGGEIVNPSLEALARLPETVRSARLLRLTLPVVFGRSADLAIEAMAAEQPDAVLCLGQAGGRSGLTPERVAVNLQDATVPDNAGNQPRDCPVVPGGPAAYFSTLPVKAMTEAIRAAGVPVSLSLSAGAYVCNHLMYSVLHAAATRWPWMRCGFLHLPYMHQQVIARPGVPSLSLDDMVRGLEAAITAIAEAPQA